MLYVVGNRVTYLDNIMYVVRWKSPTISLYDMDTLSPLNEVISIKHLLDIVRNVRGLIDPRDIVVCRHDRQLYVADWDCIWRVSVDERSYVKWMNTQFRVWSMSLTSQHLLMTSADPPILHQYNTTNKQLLCDVQLPRYVKVLYHAVETTRGTFVICHLGTSQYKKYAVSELLRFCDVLHH